LSEPFVGTLTGTVLIIPARYSKSRMEKQIELDVEHIPIVLEMQARFESWKNKVNKPVFKYFTDKYSKEFKRCCKAVGIDRRFHDLRHTFAVRRYLMTRDIYQVMKEMGHSKISTTEIYSKFNDRRLETDFPILAGMYNKTAKIGGNGYPLMDTKVIYSS
jgi:integrase